MKLKYSYFITKLLIVLTDILQFLSKSTTKQMFKRELKKQQNNNKNNNKALDILNSVFCI